MNLNKAKGLRLLSPHHSNRHRVESKNDVSIRVLLADDHKIVRQGLRSLLEEEADMKAIAEAETDWGC